MMSNWKVKLVDSESPRNLCVKKQFRELFVFLFCSIILLSCVEGFSNKKVYCSNNMYLVPSSLR